MPKVVKLKRGFNIRLLGEADKVFGKTEPANYYAVKPVDFHGISPKLNVKAGDKVKNGSPLFFDKKRPDIKFTSPVSGEVTDIKRGAKRRILEIVVQNDHKNDFLSFKQGDINDFSKEDIIKNMLESGLWPCIKQRPYNIVADPDAEPKGIFISAFDTAPLAPDMDFIMGGAEDTFQAGINVLNKLTSGKIHVGVNADYPPAKAFTNAENVVLHYFSGAHPAGNVGIQIHHISPINKGEIAWTIDPQDVIAIGRLFQTGIYDPSKIIALTGSEVDRPRYYRMIKGESVSNIINDNNITGNVRIISGNVLTGTKIEKQGFLGYFDHQVTIIPEGNQYEMFGWLKPGFNKLSAHKSFFSWLMPGKNFKMNTNLHGGRRAFVVSGEYEKVLPMDMYPVHLIKAILVKDIDEMENLGIYEVVEEDLALCEFVCTSKTKVQQILREGINLMIEETT